MIREVTDIVGITLEPSKNKHAETIEKLEGAYASLKKALKIEVIVIKIIVVQVSQHYSAKLKLQSYHTSIVCELSRVLNGCTPYKDLDLNLGIRPIETTFSRLKNYPRRSRTNGNDFSSCSQECYPSLHQKQCVLSQERKRFKTDRTRNCPCFTVGSRTSTEKNSPHRKMMDWSLYCRTSFTN